MGGNLRCVSSRTGVSGFLILERSAEFFSGYLDELALKAGCVLPVELVAAASLVDRASASGGKVLVVGNGGSAAIASHVVIDLVKAAGRRAMTFNEASLLTCYGNDFGFANWVAEAISSYADEGDVAVLISSSGESDDIVNGAERALDMGLPVVTLSGFNSANRLRQMGEINLWVDSSSYNVVEITHQTWLLMVIDYLIEQDKNRLG